VRVFFVSCAGSFKTSRAKAQRVPERPGDPAGRRP
jgi:hypothetical protein